MDIIDAKMPDDIVLTSTTDTRQQMLEALGLAPPSVATTDGDETSPDEAPGEEALAEEELGRRSQQAPSETIDVQAETRMRAEGAAPPEKRKKPTWKNVQAERQAQMNAMRKELGELEQKTAAERARLEELRKQVAVPAQAEPKPAPPQEEQKLKPRPKLDDFTTTEDFEMALETWDTERQVALIAAAKQAAIAEVAVVRAQEEAATAARDHAEHVAKYQASLADARAKHADFDTVVSDAIQISGPLEAALLRSSLGAEAAYWLGSHPDQAEGLSLRAAGLLVLKGPEQAVDQVRRELETLVKEAATPAKEIPPAPASTPKKVIPPAMPPVAAGAHAHPQTSADFAAKGDFAAYMAQRDREEAESYGRM